MGFPDASVVENPPGNAQKGGLNPWFRKIPRRRKWQPTPVFLPGQRSYLVTVHGSQGELDTTLQINNNKITLYLIYKPLKPKMLQQLASNPTTCDCKYTTTGHLTSTPALNNRFKEFATYFSGTHCHPFN